MPVTHRRGIHLGSIIRKTRKAFSPLLVLVGIQVALSFTSSSSAPLSPEDVTRALSVIRVQDDKVDRFFRAVVFKSKRDLEQETLALVAATRNLKNQDRDHPSMGQPIVHLW